MCGFLGYFSPSSAGEISFPAPLLEKALELLRHRGPDDAGVESGPGWWMGFRRLAILDLSAAAHQPMSFGAGRWLTFNGEIYNYRELRREFDEKTFLSSGDTELLGWLIDRDGAEAALRKLRGMFAIAWWDSERRILTLARDAFGIKPLYVHADESGVLVSSEIAPLRFLLGERLRVSRTAVGQYFRWGSVQGPATVLESVESLLPGEVRTWSGNEFSGKRYFAPKWPAKRDWVNDEGAIRAEVRARVIDSVRHHLISDVPVGVFLSGGLDSTIICAAMKELGVPKIRAFSVGYEGPAGVEDESDAARKTAEHLGVEFNVEKVSSKGLFESFDDFITHLDQPSGDALNVYLVSRAASRHVKVALSGLGADEMFGGYNHYRMLKIAMALRAWRFVPGRATVAKLFDSLPARAKVNRAVRTLAYITGARGGSVPELFASARTIMASNDVRALLGGSGSSSGENLYPREWPQLAGGIEQAAPDSWLNQILLLETQTYLTNTLLRDADCMSMAHSLELRVPFVDLDVFTLAGRVPPGLKLGAKSGKLILREAFRDVLPPWIYDDRKKKTFTLPLMRWLREPIWKDRVHDVLGSTACKDRGWFDPKEVESHLGAFHSLEESGKRVFVYSQRVWQMFVLESWAQRHLDSVVRENQ
ncbi:MAG: asparagine synthase (glutamine-hydrolyzing) [Chthoniobacteraceae bacterium]